MNNNSPEKQLIDKISTVNNILVTVSHNPTVDQLVSALGLSLALNKLNKRAVAVFSGKIPDVLKFLHPEKTFENNADSLRDFIISLNKDKADRIKVVPEGDFAKVYITPYRSRITPDDLTFSDGDFNIELIVAIGVADRNDLDASIASHGKIFHNAVTATINTLQIDDALGNISWQNGRFACYSEMVYELTNQLLSDQPELIDDAIATAFLTGVVAATDQFGNSVTNPQIMNLAAKLMSLGANQQLIASQLEDYKEQVQPVTAKPRPAVAPEKKPADIKLEHPELVSYGEIEDPIERRLKEDRDNFGRAQGFNALQAAHAELMGVQQDNMQPDTTLTSAQPATATSRSVDSDNRRPTMIELPRVSNAILSQIPDEPVMQRPAVPSLPPLPPLPLSSNNDAQPQASSSIPTLEVSPVESSLPPLPPAAQSQESTPTPTITLPPLPTPEPSDMPLPPIPPAPADNSLGNLPPIPPAPQIDTTTNGLPPLPTPEPSDMPLPPIPPAPADNNLGSLPPIPPLPANGEQAQGVGQPSDSTPTSQPRDPSQFVIPSM